jgi:hypothetical protein
LIQQSTYRSFPLTALPPEQCLDEVTVTAEAESEIPVY